MGTYAPSPASLGSLFIVLSSWSLPQPGYQSGPHLSLQPLLSSPHGNKILTAALASLRGWQVAFITCLCKSRPPPRRKKCTHLVSLVSTKEGKTMKPERSFKDGGKSASWNASWSLLISSFGMPPLGESDCHHSGMHCDIEVPPPQTSCTQTAADLLPMAQKPWSLCSRVLSWRQSSLALFLVRPCLLVEGQSSMELQ